MSEKEKERVEAILASIIPRGRSYLSHRWNSYNEHTREDLLQEAGVDFVALLLGKEIPKRDVQCEQLFWVILRRTVYDFDRVRMNHEQMGSVDDLLADYIGPYGSANPDTYREIDLEEAMRQTLSKEEYRAVLYRRDGYTLGEIAAIMGVSRPTIKKWLVSSKGKMSWQEWFGR